MKLVITDDIQIWRPVEVALVTMIDQLSSTINEKIGSKQSLSAFKQQATTVRRRYSLVIFPLKLSLLVSFLAIQFLVRKYAWNLTFVLYFDR